MATPSAQDDPDMQRVISHETGHALCCCALGVPPSSVVILNSREGYTAFEDPADARKRLVVTCGALMQIASDFGHTYDEIRRSDLASVRADVAALTGVWHTDDADLFRSAPWQAAIRMARQIVATERPFSEWLKHTLATSPRHRVYALAIARQWLALSSDEDYGFLLAHYFDGV